VAIGACAPMVAVSPCAPARDFYIAADGFSRLFTQCYVKIKEMAV
jgi:hypothetical protein